MTQVSTFVEPVMSSPFEFALEQKHPYTLCVWVWCIVLDFCSVFCNVPLWLRGTTIPVGRGGSKGNGQFWSGERQVLKQKNSLQKARLLESGQLQTSLLFLGHHTEFRGELGKPFLEVSGSQKLGGVAEAPLDEAKDLIISIRWYVHIFQWEKPCTPTKFGGEAFPRALVIGLYMIHIWIALCAWRVA